MYLEHSILLYHMICLIYEKYLPRQSVIILYYWTENCKNGMKKKIKIFLGLDGLYFS